MRQVRCAILSCLENCNGFAFERFSKSHVDSKGIYWLCSEKYFSPAFPPSGRFCPRTRHIRVGFQPRVRALPLSRIRRCLCLNARSPRFGRPPTLFERVSRHASLARGRARAGGFLPVLAIGGDPLGRRGCEALDDFHFHSVSLETRLAPENETRETHETHETK